MEEIRYIRLTNPYMVAGLRTEGLDEGILSQDHGYLEYLFEATPETQAILDRFDQPHPVNLRDYVNQLRRVQDEIRNVKLKRREKYEKGYFNNSTRI